MQHSRLLLCFLLVIAFQSTSGQQKVLLKGIMLPNKVYKAEMANNADMLMTVKGDSATMAEIATSGMQSPINMTIKQDIFMTTKTGAQQADKKIPVTMTYDKMTMSTNIAGKETSQDTNPYADATIHGTTMGDGKINIDTITGNLNDALKLSLKNTINTLQGNMKFPEKELQVGESFDQDLPLVVPVAQMQIKMKIRMKGTLKEIKDAKAIFDIKQDIILDMSMEDGGNKFSGSGSGTGVMIFDIKNKFLDQYDSDIQYQIIAELETMTMDINCKAKQRMKYIIE